MIREYSKNELLNRVRDADGYMGIPDYFWILGVQSLEDRFNEFDDVFYLFRGTDLIMRTTGTTNAGLTGLKNYGEYNSEGCAVLKTNQWTYGLWRFGYHRGKMPALKQIRAIKYYRDWNKNEKAEQLGRLREGIIGINFHTVTYQGRVNFVRKLIGGWSTGCQVVNNVMDYFDILDRVRYEPEVSYCLIKEF